MYDQINKYANEVDAPKAMKEPELVSILARMEKERCYMSSLVMEAKDCLQKIYRYSEPSPHPPMQDGQAPADLTTEMHRQLNLLNEQNSELAAIVRHIRQIIG